MKIPERSCLPRGRLAAALAATVLAAACAGPAPTPASDSGSPSLSCTLPSNCVSSVAAGGMAPLRYAGTPAQALAALQATLESFAEASVVRREALQLEVIFTTPLGFRDQVDFVIDPAAQRIDFRSRSLLGLYDFGKNRARMTEFTARFERQRPR